MTDYSVLMSVYEKEKPEYLKAAIDSMLNQTIPTNDFVLVCDGPLTDCLEAVIVSFQSKLPDVFHVYRLYEHQGLAKALNYGILQCRNEIIVRMDSDDISVLERVEKQLYAMERERADIVGSNIAEFNGSIENITGERIVPNTNQEILSFVKKRSPFNHPGVIYKKQAVLKAGMYENYRFFEDYHLWAVMLKKGCRGYNVQENLLYMRAGDEMYKRRGGIRYIRHIFRFENSLKKMGYLNIFEFFWQGVSRAAVSVIPNAIRKKVYLKKLREQTYNKKRKT